MANSIVINVLAKVTGVRDVEKLKGKLTNLTTSKGFQSAVTGVGISAGMAAWNALGGAMSMAGDVMSDSIKAASGLRESMSLANQVFEQNAEKVEAWGKTAADSFGMSQREALDFASNFGTAFKNVGMSLDETTDKAETM